MCVSGVDTLLADAAPLVGVLSVDASITSVSVNHTQ